MHTLSTRTLSALAYDRGEEYDPAEPVAPDLLEAPAVLGVEQITVDGAVVRTTMKTASEKQWSLARELRRRLTEALESAGITAHITGTRGFVRPRHPSSDSASSADPGDHGVGGAT